LILEPNAEFQNFKLHSKLHFNYITSIAIWQCGRSTETFFLGHCSHIYTKFECWI